MKRTRLLIVLAFLFTFTLSSEKVVSEVTPENNGYSYSTEDKWIEIASPEELKQTADMMGMNIVTFKYEESSSLQSFKANGESETSTTIANYFVPENMPIVMATTSAGTKEETDPIVYYAAKVTTKINYSKYTSGNVLYVKLTSCSGNVHSLDNGWSFVSQTVRYATNGTYDGNPFGSQNYTQTTSNRSFSYTAPSGWKAVNSRAYCQIGLSDTITLKHGNQTYTAVVVNQY